MDLARELNKLYAKAFPEVLKAHGELYVRSGGRIGHKLLFGVPSLIVRTVGAKSGSRAPPCSPTRRTAPTTWWWRRRAARPAIPRGSTTW
ncbi:hypothetical protein MTP03_24460 [Tsukamurella sp. PLM1]|nr:hypothetical protein MTP03_24460 [Tsukamurella sp. PLM1]